jgi:hypothetical protein
MKSYTILTIVISLFCFVLITIDTLCINNDSAFAESQVALSIVLHNTTPTIQKGETLEIWALISGSGIPEKNKLIISWSSPNVIDKKDPGTIQIGDGDPIGIDPNGNITILPLEFFSNSPIVAASPNFGLPLIKSETSLRERQPIILKLNSSKTARSGDYDISFIFTYSDGISMFQDYKTTQFHVSSWWEQNQTWMQILAVIVALLSLITGAVFSLLSYRKTPKKQKS